MNIILTLLIILTLCSYFIILNQISNNIAFEKQLEYTQQYIKDENWGEAIRSSHSIKDKWKQLRFITIVNDGEGDIGTLEEHINMLVAGTESRDSVTALSSSMHIKDLWDNMGKIVPGP